MSGLRSRRKGHAFERWVANRFKIFFPYAERKLEYQESEADGIDLKNTGNFRVQCKAYKNYAPISKIEEIKKKDGIPLLVTKGDNKPPMVVLSLSDFMLLITPTIPGGR